MSASDADSDSPLVVFRRIISNSWSTIKTIYWANSLSWRALKSGALVFLGFFVWAGSNIIYSYNSAWDLLLYPIAYGFLLIVYGPIHHLVVLPLAMRLRRTSGLTQIIGKRLPNSMLVLFIIAVVIVGTFPVNVMLVNFQSTLDDGGIDINPNLLCVKSTNQNGTSVHCHLTESRGVDRVVVTSGGTQLTVDENPPFEFTIAASNMESVVGEKQFTVKLLDENGNLVRRYTRRLALIEETS
ncbi:MAG: hypothetical protein ABEI86_09400 [Halobacteriaceae archaeon]